MLLAAAFAGYQQLFSTYADYDDEGYVMLSLASFMDGKPLYDETYSQYGPAYYVVESLLHRATGLEVSHDVTRLKTLATWLGAAVLAFALLTRLTGSWWIGAAACLIAFFHLDRLCLEPGHPQELCTLAIVATPLLLARGCLPDVSRAAPFALGMLVGCTLMTKANVGVLLLVATSWTLVLLGPRDRVSRLLTAVMLPATLLMPFVLTKAHLRAPGGIALPAVVALSTLAALVTASRERDAPVFAWGHALGFVAGVVIAAGGFAMLAVAHGTSFAGLYHGLVAQHAGFVTKFASPVGLHVVAIGWASLAVVMALAAGRVAWTATTARLMAGLALGWCCVRYGVEAFVPLSHGMVDRGAAVALIGIASPTMWVLLVPSSIGPERSERPTDRRFASRLTLGLLACVQPLGAYPTPGTQVAVGSVAVALGCVLALDDLVRGHVSVPRVRVAMAALLACVLLVRGTEFAARRSSLVRLDLPGARWLRVAPAEAARYRWLAETLRTRTDTFVFAERTRGSFYFWTGLPPPTALNPTVWPFMLRPAEEQQVIAALERRPRAGMVHDPSATKPPPDSLLAAYLSERFRPALTDGTLEVWLRTPR